VISQFSLFVSVCMLVCLSDCLCDLLISNICLISALFKKMKKKVWPREHIVGLGHLVFICTPTIFHRLQVLFVWMGGGVTS